MTPTKFEDRLLTELRAVVAARPAPEVVTASRRSPRGRLVLATGAVAATAAGVLIATGGDTAAPAYAVEKQPNGNVTVEIHSLRDAAGLQEKLRAAGIPRSSTTPRWGRCAVPREGGWPRAGIRSACAWAYAAGTTRQRSPSAGATCGPARRS